MVFIRAMFFKPEKDPNKSVLIANGRGEFATYSTEETLAKGLNKFEGWMCAAGIETIHIGTSGNVLLAACNIHGTHGNVFDGTLDLPKKWVTCDRKACMCGGDMQIRKCESVRYQQRSMNPISGWAKQVDSIEDMKWVSPYHYDEQRKQPKTVSWDMGKRCNYACSYCPPEVSNRTEPLRTWEELKSSTDHVIKKFIGRSKAKWVITGGEPTIIPAYLDWVDYVHGKGHLVHTTTNGSRGPKYMEKLIEKSLIGLSVHLEFMDLNRLTDTVQAVVEKKMSSQMAKVSWFGVRVMVPPGQVEKAIEVKERLLSIPNFSESSHFFMSPIHDYYLNSDEQNRLTFGDLAKYSQDELSTIQSFA